MISKKTKYALNALMKLTEEYEKKKPVLISHISQKHGISRKFLEAILLELKNKGILTSKKGKGGGYLLARHPSQISMGEVIRILEGPLAPLPCVSLTAYRKCEECEDEATCGIRMVMKQVRDATAEIWDNTSLLEVSEKSHPVIETYSI